MWLHDVDEERVSSHFPWLSAGEARVLYRKRSVTPIHGAAEPVVLGQYSD